MASDKHEREILVRNFPNNETDKLRNLFLKFGIIENIESCKSRHDESYYVITFSKISSVKEAITSEIKYEDNSISVKPSKHSTHYLKNTKSNTKVSGSVVTEEKLVNNNQIVSKNASFDVIPKIESEIFKITEENQTCLTRLEELSKMIETQMSRSQEVRLRVEEQVTFSVRRQLMQTLTPFITKIMENDDSLIYALSTEEIEPFGQIGEEILPSREEFDRFYFSGVVFTQGQKIRVFERGWKWQDRVLVKARVQLLENTIDSAAGEAHE